MADQSSRATHMATFSYRCGIQTWSAQARGGSSEARKTSVGNKVPPFSLADYMADRLGMQTVGLTTGGVPALPHMAYHTPTHRVEIWCATCLRKSLPRQQSATRWHALSAGKRASQ